MKISIIIPCLNEENFLPHLIIDLKNQTLKPYEIIVVDAGSEDKTLDRVQSDDLVKVVKTKPNIGAQRKLGGDMAGGDLLFFLDADVRLVADFLEKNVEKINRQKLALASFVYVPYSTNGDGRMENSNFSISMVYFFINFLMFSFQLFSPSGAGSGIFVTKELFDKTGGYRDDLKFDDIEFIRRASKFGKFRQIRSILLVSDRRFLRYGVIKTFVSYLVLSFFFLFNAFKYAEIVEYKFSDYKKNS